MRGELDTFPPTNKKLGDASPSPFLNDRRLCFLGHSVHEIDS